MREEELQTLWGRNPDSGTYSRSSLHTCSAVLKTLKDLEKNKVCIVSKSK